MNLSQRLELKQLQYKYSGNKLKLHYLINITYLQKKDISDVENILSLSAYVLKFYFKLMKKVVQSHSEEPPIDSDAGKRSEKSQWNVVPSLDIHPQRVQ